MGCLGQSTYLEGHRKNYCYSLEGLAEAQK